MADIDIDPFVERNVIDETTDKTFTLIPTGGGDTSQIDVGIHETDFGGMSINIRVLRDQVEGLYEKFEHLGKKSEQIYTDLFEMRDGELFYKTENRSLTIKGRLRSAGAIAEILGK